MFDQPRTLLHLMLAILGRLLFVLNPDGALDDVGILLAPKQHGAEKDRVILRWALPGEEHVLRILPACIWNLARTLLPRGAMERDAVHPVKKHRRVAVLLRGDDPHQECRQRDKLRRLRVVRGAREAPQVFAPHVGVVLTSLGTDGVGERLRISPGKFCHLSLPGLLFVLPNVAVFLGCSRFEDDVLREVLIEEGLEAYQGGVIVGQHAAKQFRSRPIEDPYLPFDLVPLFLPRLCVLVLLLVLFLGRMTS
mmetsp:Transcript_61953/g.134253  ORF Transcript_61953/g.134253 Transcript_61953/m.134253 type:complete len:251 (-) Transcript_61953:1878-2630(-)